MNSFKTKTKNIEIRYSRYDSWTRFSELTSESIKIKYTESKYLGKLIKKDYMENEILSESECLELPEQLTPYLATIFIMMEDNREDLLDKDLECENMDLWTPHPISLSIKIEGEHSFEWEGSYNHIGLGRFENKYLLTLIFDLYHSLSFSDNGISFNSNLLERYDTICHKVIEAYSS